MYVYRIRPGSFKRFVVLRDVMFLCCQWLVSQEREEVDEIDLRKVTDLKGPDPTGTFEQQCCLQIILSDR